MSESKDISSVLNRIFSGETLSRNEASEVMGYLMDGSMSQLQAAALLAALRTRGETVEEITGFAEAMRSRSVKVPFQHEGVLLDTCSTGGTGINTINIGTTSMFVIAASGVKIAKHGNRAVTRRSSSADTLEALGVRLEQTPEQAVQALNNVGITFLFARSHHPAMKFVAPIRAELKARTVFNILGPLTNPAGANRQVLGVFSPTFVEPLAGVLNALGTERALVVHGDGLDDLTVSGETFVTEVKDGTLKSYTLTPEEVGLRRSRRDDLLGGDGAENAQTLREILAGSIQGAKRDVVLLNAGAGLYVSDKASSIKEGVELARSLTDSGKALEKLEAYLAFDK
jgi:anthranilate phosphoribosyltransferase